MGLNGRLANDLVIKLYLVMKSYLVIKHDNIHPFMKVIQSIGLNGGLANDLDKLARLTVICIINK